MVEPITRNGLVYTPLFRTFASYNDGRSSYYYLHKESGMGYRVRFDGRGYHEVFLGMRTIEKVPCVGGFEIVAYIQKHSGVFPHFSPQIGLGLRETFEDSRFTQLVYPCGLVMWDNHPFVLCDVVESLDKEKIVLKSSPSPHLQFHYSHALVEMYDAYNPLEYLQS